MAASASGNQEAVVSAALTRSRIARSRGEPARAALILEADVGSAREHGRSAQLRECLVELSEVMADQWDNRRAYDLAREALR